jgi:teichuronic acid biosynthesis glycosyltransferase TuaC
MLDGAGTQEARKGILVFTSVFPNSAQPGLGLFVRERMFRVAGRRPMVVVAPVPWFPFQSLLKLWRPHFRPMPPMVEWQQGIEVLHPRFLSVPGLFKSLDSLSMALFSWNTVRRLRKRFVFHVIDSHFAFPDGFAAVKLGRWLGLPVTITLRGTEVSLSRYKGRRHRIVEAVNRADRVFTVADSIKDHLAGLGARTDHVLRVGNGVDCERFRPEPKNDARRRLDIPQDAKVLIGVGALCERKGFHRVIDCLPQLLTRHPNLLYLIVGGPSPEGDWSDRLKEKVKELGLTEQVRFLGQTAPQDLRWPLSAADLFVLSTRNEGWANVFLEAMACGLPVVTTDVGGNREVVSSQDLGRVIPFDDSAALCQTLDEALTHPWDTQEIRRYAEENDWAQRVALLDEEFARLTGESVSNHRAVT